MSEMVFNYDLHIVPDAAWRLRRTTDVQDASKTCISRDASGKPARPWPPYLPQADNPLSGPGR